MITYESWVDILFACLNYVLLMYGAWYLYARSIMPEIKKQMVAVDSDRLERSSLLSESRETLTHLEEQLQGERDTYNKMQIHLADWSHVVEREKKIHQALTQQRLNALIYKKQQQHNTLRNMITIRNMLPHIIAETKQQLITTCNNSDVPERINAAIIEQFDQLKQGSKIVYGSH